MRNFSSPKRLVLTLVAVSCSFLLLPAGASAASTLGCADDATGTQDLSSWVPEMLAATNAHRTGMGLVELQLDPVLTRASVWKSRDMGRRDYFSHDDLALAGETSRTPWERLTACGWTSGGSRAENIAAGQQSGQAFITAWLNSPGHRANIENASMRYVGFGVARVTGSRYGTYATQMFASVPSGEVTPPPPPPTPAAPTITQLALDYEGAAETVCPTASAVSYRVQSVTGQVDAINSGSCVRVAPRTGVGGVTATVDYYARGDAGGTSATVRMTVTVAAAPPPPPPVPEAPTTTRLDFAYMGATQTICPTASGVSHAVDRVEGWIVAGTTTAGCLRVSPVSGIGGVTAYVTYHAVHVLGQVSASTRLTVTVAAAPAPEPEPDPEPTPNPDPIPDPDRPTPPPAPTPPAPTPPAPTEPTPPAPDPVVPTPADPDPIRKPVAAHPDTLRGTRAALTRYRCRGQRAVRGWCWRVVVTGRLVGANGHAVSGARVALARMVGARRLPAGSDRTDASGLFVIRVELRPPARGTARWLTRNAGRWLVDASTSPSITLRARGT